MIFHYIIVGLLLIQRRGGVCMVKGAVYYFSLQAAQNKTPKICQASQTEFSTFGFQFSMKLLP